MTIWSSDDQLLTIYDPAEETAVRPFGLIVHSDNTEVTIIFHFLIDNFFILFHPRYNLRRGLKGSSWTTRKKPVKALFSGPIAMHRIVSIAKAIHSLTHSVIVLSLADLRGLQVCLYTPDVVPINLNAI